MAYKFDEQSALARMRDMGITASPITFGMVKSDAIYRDNDVIIPTMFRMIHDAGFYVPRMVLDMGMTESEIREFYHDKVSESYFPQILNSVSGDLHTFLIARRPETPPWVCAVEAWRNIIGATNSAEAKPGTLRHRFGGWRILGSPIADNAFHGSDSLENAIREVRIVSGDGRTERELEDHISRVFIPHAWQTQSNGSRHF